MYIHANWPDSIERYRLKGVIGLSTVVTDPDVMNLNRHRAYLSKLEKHVRNNLASFFEAIRTNGFEPGRPPSFRLLIDQDKAYALEEASRTAILIGRLGA